MPQLRLRLTQDYPTPDQSHEFYNVLDQRRAQRKLLTQWEANKKNREHAKVVSAAQHAAALMKAGAIAAAAGGVTVGGQDPSLLLSSLSVSPGEGNGGLAALTAANIAALASATAAAEALGMGGASGTPSSLLDGVSAPRPIPRVTSSDAAAAGSLPSSVTGASLSSSPSQFSVAGGGGGNNYNNNNNNNNNNNSMNDFDDGSSDGGDTTSVDGFTLIEDPNTSGVGGASSGVGGAGGGGGGGGGEGGGDLPDFDGDADAADLSTVSRLQVDTDTLSIDSGISAISYDINSLLTAPTEGLERPKLRYLPFPFMPVPDIELYACDLDMQIDTDQMKKLGLFFVDPLDDPPPPPPITVQVSVSSVM